MSELAVKTWPVDNPKSERWPIYTRGNVGEVFPSVVSPLGWTLIGPAAEQGWRQAYYRLGAARPSDFSESLNILGVFNGYCYLNASVLRVLGVRAPGGTPEAIDQQLLGDSSAPPYEERRGDSALMCRSKMLRTVLGLLREQGVPGDASAAREVADRHIADRPDLDQSDDVLVNYLTGDFVTEFSSLFQTHIEMTSSSSLMAGYLSWLCLRAGDLGFLVQLSTDVGQVESALPGEAMWRLSRLVRTTPEVGAIFNAGLTDLESRLRATPEATEFLEGFDVFLAEHGHRGPNEWELASATWRSDPSIPLVAIDRMRGADDDHGPDNQRSRVSSERSHAEAEMALNLSWWDRRNLRKVVAANAAYARGREMTRNQIIRVVNAAREVAYELARRAEASGGVEPRLAFMLEQDEFIAYLGDPSLFHDVIAERDALRIRLDAIEPPFVIADEIPTTEEHLSSAPDERSVVPPGTEIQGNAGSPGVARGRARVVMHPSDPGDLSQGDILVAPLTDPSWTPLFLAASGVVVDVGATVSHAVVVSRELCIPCVVGVKHATQIIPDGALVEIDGAAGVVRVLDHEPPQAALRSERAEDQADSDRASEVVSIDAELDLDSIARRQLLGGKGANLVEMRTALDLPVPPAFVITTNACRSYLSGTWPIGLDDRIHSALDALGERLGRRFGDPTRPFLVSVRSGAPVSMPGMMDTVLNVGMNPSVRDALATETGDPVFAAQTWLRFCRMYAEIVLGMSQATIDTAVDTPSTSSAAELNAAADRLRSDADLFGSIPTDPRQQVRRSVEAVFASWHSDRARTFRQREGIDDDLGTAVTVQAMVFGNLDDRSGTGVVFTRDPSTGARELYGDYLARAQGEDVVSGSHAVGGLDALADHEPIAHERLVKICDRLERHYRDMCDIEFTVAASELYILQTRVGRRTPEATIRIAAEMAADPDFPLTKAEAVARIEHSTLEAVAKASSVASGAQSITSGNPVSPGVGVGELCTNPDRAAAQAAAGRRVVLVRTTTSPADVHGMVEAAGLVTSLGGSVSHAAVVARSWGIPAVTGASAVEVVEGGVLIDEQFIAEGTVITVDGSGGGLFLGDQLADHTHDLPELDTLRSWAVDLGVELGEVASTAPAEPVGDAVVGRFEVVRAVQLKGICSADTVASVLGSNVALVARVLPTVAEFVTDGPRGMSLSGAGQQWLNQELEAERGAVDSAGLAAVYAEFLPLNARFKELVSSWQMSTQSESDYASTSVALGVLHEEFTDLLSSVSDLAPRLAVYPTRFQTALDAIDSGDVSMLASPLKDSYHTVWFEYHEELIHLAGKSRLEEESADQERYSE